MNKQRLLFIALIIFSLFTACKKDNNSPDDSRKSVAINQFIWYNMSFYYLWTDNVPKLSGEYFNNDTNKLNTFLNGYADHEKLFDDLLYQKDVIDKWSWIESDYKKLENELQGISKSMGFNFGLVRLSGSDNIFGYVRYVLKGSPAEKAGVQRGNIFIKVDDQQLTINNYQTLLFSGKDQYKLGFADIVGSSIQPNNKTTTITAVEFQENPIFLDTVYTINNTKIGYLVYNGFYSDYDAELNQVFQDFKGKGVQKLILDLRYNGGGSTQTATYLASMIYGTYTDKVFSKNQFNTYLQDVLVKEYGNDFLVSNFTNKIEKDASNPETPIVTLNLNDVYIITTESTASASELVINGLKAYIPVKTVGSNTVGKYVGSITIKDEDANGNVNPNNTWAMQLIVVKIANSKNESDFTNGFTPDIAAEEDLRDLRPLGRTDESLLNAALSSVTGQAIPKAKRIPLNVQYVADSKDLVPHGKEMYLNLPKTLKTNK